MNTHIPADRLRIIRKSKGWSLQDVERNSNGKWKAVVIGSYERSDRSISLRKAISLMEFYQVPISELFPEISPEMNARSISINLAKLADDQSINSESLRKFTKSISDRRKDWNGKLLTIRANDLQFLSLLLGLNESTALDYLTEADLLIS
ncbi:MAG: helix-turn-helix domain-containing protein [Actinobacteria bacterium]|nr:helix-turn-helix domain-containing protein [Actinomycetota bacterium]